MEVAGKYLLVGGFDENIRIYNIKKYNEVGILSGHQGSIQQLRTHKNMVFSCSEDQKIIIWKNKEWAQLVKLKEHKASVLDLVIHESGKIMLSVSKDNRMIIWNLLNAQKVFVKKFNFSNRLELFRLSPTSQDLSNLERKKKRITLLSLSFPRYRNFLKTIDSAPRGDLPGKS